MFVLIITAYFKYFIKLLIKGKGFYIVSGGASAYYTYSHLTTTIRQKGFDAQVSDVTEDIGVLSIQGPNRYCKVLLFFKSQCLTKIIYI